MDLIEAIAGGYQNPVALDLWKRSEAVCSYETPSNEPEFQKAVLALRASLIRCRFFICHFLPKKRMSSPRVTQLLCKEQHPLGVLVPFCPL